jgi:hypothetical protein
MVSVMPALGWRSVLDVELTSCIGEAEYKVHFTVPRPGAGADPWTNGEEMLWKICGTIDSPSVNTFSPAHTTC